MSLVRNIFCEFRLSLFRVLHAFAGKGQELRQSKDKLDLIENLLPDNPTWANGHLARAMLIVERRYRFAADPSPQDLAALRVSLKAVETLSGDEVQRVITVWFGYAMLLFFERKMEEALRCFRDLAARSDLDVLDAWQVIAVFECAAACSIALGREGEAKSFLEQIPPNERSPEASELLNMLSRKS